jgi:N-acetylglucosamine-6-sulfatase
MRLAILGATLLVLACQSAALPPPHPEPRPSPSPSPSPVPPARPNILLIVTDDLDVIPLSYMPALKAHIADKGVTFRNSFVVQPTCAPSRASLLTGRYAHNHGLVDNKPPLGGYKRYLERGNEESSLPVWMRAASYRTGLVGKYLNRYPGAGDQRHVPPGWDDWRALFFPETYVNYTLNENGQLSTFGEEDKEYQTDVLAARALDFLRKKDDRPYFLYLSPFAPHAPAEPATRHEQTFPDLKAPRAPSFNEEDVSDKPSWVRALPPISEETAKASDDWFRRRIQTLQAVDEMIGRIFEVLEARGDLDRTYVIFTSDNGFQFGAHRLDHGKGDPYEESIRVPLYVRGPGIPAGSGVDHLVLNIDLTPTFAAIAGATLPANVDGRSLLPLLGPNPPGLKDWRHEFLVEHGESGKARERDDEEGGIPEYSALRTEDYLYAEYPKTNERELYDLNTDPYELKSIHATVPKQVLKRLGRRLAELRTCSGESCRK